MARLNGVESHPWTFPSPLLKLLNALRTSTLEANNLAEALRRAIEDGRRNGILEASLNVTGDARAMHPVVRDDVYRIGYEAIRNAYTHSRGSRLDVAARIGAILSVTSAHGKGTAVALTVPGRGIFLKASGKLSARIRSLLFSTCP